MLRRLIAPVTILVLLIVAIAQRPDAPTPPTTVMGEHQEEAESRPDDWFWMQRSFPNGAIDHDGYKLSLSQARAKQQEAQVMRQSKTNDPLLSAAWEQKGPTNVCARVTDLAVHPTNADICYAGIATGGVFKTTDGGTDWTPIFDQQDVLSVGAVTLDPQNPETVYVGTGEANAASLSFFGTGLYRSTNGGLNWEHLGLEDTRYIARVIVDPTDSERLFVAATGQLFGSDEDRGVFRSTNGGQDWDRVFALTDSTACTDLVMHPTNPEILYAAMWERVRGRTYRNNGGPSSGIWRSLDGGDSWNELTTGLPTDNEVGRIGLTICASQPDVLYAIYCEGGSYASFRGVYKTTSGGDSWNDTNDGALSSIYSSFGWYFGQIRVDPTNPDNVFAMGVPMYRSTNGGSSWSESGGNMHVDHHAMAFCPSQPNRVYQGNDGGLHRSDNYGSSWTKLYNQPTSQFYGIEIDYQDPTHLLGGTQDNGTLRTPDGSVDNWERIFGGDGFQTIVDYTDSDIIYCEYQNGMLQKSTNGGDWFSQAMNGIEDGDRHNWNTPIAMDPVNPQVLYYGSQRVYRTNDAADLWFPISGDLTDGDQGAGFGTVTTIAVAPSSPAVVYAGTDDGNVWAYRPFSGNWVSISDGLPKRWVTRLAVDTNDHRIVYATFSGLRWNEPISHVYRTTDAGVNWEPISNGLPEAPVNVIVVDPDHTQVLYVGTDVGVYYSPDTGASWQVLGVGLPRAPVLDLKFHRPTRMLAAGTHGRSIFTVTAPDPVTAVGEVPQVATLSLSAVPNPFNPQTVLSFALTQDGPVKLDIFSVRGERVAQPIDGYLQAGDHTVHWNGRDLEGRELASGTYLARLQAGGEVTSAKLLLAR